MAKNPIPVNSVRASRDGHEFHEAWTARRAMQLLLQTDDLIGIAVEGPEPADHAAASSETVEIADIIMYYGKRPTFKDADRINIVQFKYSISNSDDDFRAKDAKKTIVKFAAAYLDHKKRYGAKEVRNKLEFELKTNRPIFQAFKQAIHSIANGKPLSGEVENQAKQFKKACGLDGKSLVEFAGKCVIKGSVGSLTEIKKDQSRTLVDWYASSDPMAQASLGKMRQLVRDKAGSAGANKNVIRRVDVLDALGVQHEDDLFPCPASFPKIDTVVERQQQAEAIVLINKLDKPLLIHAAGGVGKTVFLESLARVISNKHEVFLFDCFGGGAYRAPEDSRHLPKRGFVHIVNNLACLGLCDPLLPSNDDEELVRAFRRRLSQSVQTLSTASAERKLVIFIDAIDNAEQHALDRNEKSFPTLLLESFHYGGQIPGVKLVVSCRSHRIGQTMKTVPYLDFKLEQFSLSETETYLRNHLPNVTQTEIQVAQARSGGNARILEHLVTSDRGLLDKSEIKNAIELNDLLNKRIQSALSDANNRGYKKKDTNAFLAGLSVLPPPVPLEEYAGALRMDVSAIESFAADMAPLLERTKHGLMFRDEPTETLIREKYGFDNSALRYVANNLLERQDRSVYAARALPWLLQKLDDGKGLYQLAFDERFPESITSTVGKQNIRYARLKAAVLHAANNQSYNRLVNLLIELSTITTVDQRGADYILDYPDLVIAAQDVDSTRRLFETRTEWQGTRHARLAIAYTLSGDLDDASRHALRAKDWIFHYRQQDREHTLDRAGPERLDVAAISLNFISQNLNLDAIRFMRSWRHWYAYEASEPLFSFLQQAKSASSLSSCDLSGFLDNLTDDIGVIASAVSFLKLDNTQLSQLIKKLSNACKKVNKLKMDDNINRKANYRLQDGLLKASVIAASFGLGRDSLTICRHTPHKRPGIWSFGDNIFSNQQILPFLAYKALISAVKGNELRERDILPEELYEISSGMRKTYSSVEFRKKLKMRLESRIMPKQVQSMKDMKSISYELKHDAEKFINYRLEPLLTLTKAFAKLIGSPVKKGDKAFLALLKKWEITRMNRDPHSTQRFDRLFQQLGCQLVVFALWARTDIKTASVKIFLKRLHEQEILDVSTLLEVVAVLAKRDHLHALAGEQARKARLLIENEDEVSSRATLYAQLARAILPASQDEATVYFKAGLEQMDAIGSGDYQFTNELLLFASSLRGAELDEQDFHTLTNICELNMPFEEEKFPWYAFAKGLSRTSGLMTIAKLSRWDDRSKISLDYTLLPYLTALIQDGKIEPENALALNRLSKPVELYSCNTAAFAKAIDEKNYPNHEILIRELIQQFEVNNPGVPMDETVMTLSAIAEKAFGKTSKTVKYLSAAHEHYRKVREESNEHMNYSGRSDLRISNRVEIMDKQNQAKLRQLATSTKPNDEVSLGKAIDELNEMQILNDRKGVFFATLRNNVPFTDRLQYIKIISRLENLDLYMKLGELKKCKDEWGKSSAALTSAYEELGVQILRLHAEEFVSYDQLSMYQLKNVADLSGIPIVSLALKLIKLYALPNSDTPASVWVSLASIICDEADDGEGQSALTRLLNSNSAKLASSVADGEWNDGLYPANDSTEIASGLVWRMLGSPHASDRWRAAHSVRCFAKYERWKVLDALVDRFRTEDAHPFQAPELTFYYMHARLWLLIALARIAMDNPRDIARYQKVLIGIVLDDDSPHVLLRHFASQTILRCVDNGDLKLPGMIEKKIRAIDLSPFPRLRKKLKEGMDDSFYRDRPKDMLKPKTEFYLDYDFDKYDIHGLSDVFGRSSWEVRDLISEVVRGLDPEVTSMHESGGRQVSRWNRLGGMTSRYHSYGQQLGWHSLFLTAGRLLRHYPVTDDHYYDDPWTEWLNSKLLTRKDGLWLSDCTNKPPLRVKVNLLEKSEDGLIITGSKDKILSLIGIDSTLGQEYVVDGSWRSHDNINVIISSALVSQRKANALARQLIQEESFSVWLPTYDQYENGYEHQSSIKMGFVPWTVYHSAIGGLDEDDPLGAIYAEKRPQFAENIIADFSLTPTDPVGRIFRKSARKPVAHSDVWGYKSENEDENSNMGVRLVCSSQLLSDVLAKQNADLLVLVKLRRYEKGIGSRDSSFSHTVAVVRINKTLEIEFYMGAVNKPHKMRY